MPSISSLPNELVASVIDNLRSQRDVASLCQVNRRLYEAVNPILYKNAVDRRNMWPLLFAAFSGRVSTLQKILAAGANPNFIFDAANPRTRNFPPGPPWAGPNGYSPRTSDFGDDFDVEEDADPNFILTHFEEWADDFNDPDLDGSMTGSEVDGQDHDMSDDTTTSGAGSTDSSTLGNSDRQRDGPSREPLSFSRMFTSLHIGAAMGQKAVVEVLLDNGALIDDASRQLCSCKSAVGMLNGIEGPPDASGRYPRWTPLHMAICHNRPDTAILLLRRGASFIMESSLHSGPDAAEQHGPCSTALHHAAAFGQVQLVRYLVEEGYQTELDVQDSKTLTPFYYAYANSRWESTVPLLLQMGADINLEIKFHQPYCTLTPLGEAIRLGNFEDAQKLIDLGADTSRGFFSTGTGHRKGLSPLHLGCMPSARRSGGLRFLGDAEEACQRTKIMETLIANGSDIDAANCDGETSLMSAAQNRVLPSVRVLVAAGANVNAKNKVGRTVIMQAILGPENPIPGLADDRYAQTRDNLRVISCILRELLNAGANIDAQDPRGNNILHLLFETKVPLSFAGEVMELLLGFPGGDNLLSARNNEGLLAFEMAFQTGHHQACEVLLRRGSVQRVLKQEDIGRMLEFAMSKPHMDHRVLHLLLDLDFDQLILSDPNHVEQAVTRGAWSAASVFARRGLFPTDKDTSTKFLVHALGAAEWDTAYQLIERGADVDGLCDGERIGYESPLNLVIGQLGHISYHCVERLVRILLDHGADIHASRLGSPRPLADAINQSCDTFTLVQAMLRRHPLRDEPRAVGGYYLHDTLKTSSLCRDRIVHALIRSGADLTELDENGDYPLGVLVQILYELAPVVLPHGPGRYPQAVKLLKALFAPGVSITRPNKRGHSIVHYLEALLQTKAGVLWVSPILELTETPGGAKVLNFKPETGLKRMPESCPVTTIWDSQLSL
ncbi:ankyrin repeat-containing domain protein [Coniochaeta sp. 2T2.1]|nr:ankyrin repeat-containing domain protein [Coniochaeta sp. 2T2.1]